MGDLRYLANTESTHFSFTHSRQKGDRMNIFSENIIMNKQKHFFVLLVVLIASVLHAAQKDFSYICPLPGSTFVSTRTNVIVRAGEILTDNYQINESLLIVSGSTSGNHTGRLFLEADRRTMVFNPSQPFAPGEIVTVNLQKGLRGNSGRQLEMLYFQFTITPNASPLRVPGEFGEKQPAGGTFADGVEKKKSGESISSGSSLLDLPEITITVSDNPSPGYIFLGNFVFNGSIPNTPYLLAIDNTGAAVFARQMPSRCHDFKLQPNGLFTYYDSHRQYFVALNSSLVEVDTFACGNGYSTDEHELRILPNGHALLMSYDLQIVRMDTIVTGGQPNALVLGLIIQELDQEKNVVFQWRSWDHFQIADATHEDLTSTYIDYVHGNALELDNDGNILLSSRHMDEITKINRETGEIIWRWGGRHNEFTFINDTLQFSHQHAVRRLANGHITLFDNGNFHTPAFSRAVEYVLDEQNKTAGLVWSYRDTAGTYGFAMGYTQRLETGNTLIGWGSTNPTVTEVRPNGEKAFEMTFASGVFSYRVYRFNVNLTDVRSVSATHLPSTYMLQQNYPNPFNPATTIAFSLPTSGLVSLDVFNVLGQKVESLVTGNFSAGSHSVRWNAAGQPSGVYFYRLNVDGNHVATKRMVLLK